MLETFLERAVQLSRARELVRDDAEYASATALLAVHCAIALNDAILTKLTGKTLRGQDHMAAVRETRRRCGARHLDTKGITNLERLIAAKSDVSYGERPVSSRYAAKLVATSAQFEAWAYKTLGEIA